MVNSDTLVSREDKMIEDRSEWTLEQAIKSGSFFSDSGDIKISVPAGAYSDEHAVSPPWGKIERWNILCSFIEVGIYEGTKFSDNAFMNYRFNIRQDAVANKWFVSVRVDSRGANHDVFAGTSAIVRYLIVTQ